MPTGITTTICQEHRQHFPCAEMTDISMHEPNRMVNTPAGDTFQAPYPGTQELSYLDMFLGT